jgi:trehalose 6-phosphate synthase/phosphatase
MTQFFIAPIFMDKYLRDEIIDKYRIAKNRLVLLDYDGTLVNLTPIPHTTRISDHLFDILLKIVDTPQTELYIITGRWFKEIDKIFDHLPIDIIAEHGAMIKKNGIWENKLNNNCAWKETVLPILNQVAISCPESFVEEKSFSLAWHYRNAELQSGFNHSRELISILEKTVQSYNLKVLDGNKVVEVMNSEVGKGNAVKKLFEQKKYDFILSMGDDTTDEEMFEFLLPFSKAFTIRVGNGDTFAKYKLSDINEVGLLLKQLSA